MELEVEQGFAGVTLQWLYDEINQLSRFSNQNSHPYFLAARQIQTIFRGYSVRKMIKNWHIKAKLIQKIYRGYIERKHFYEFLKIIYFNRLSNYYDKCVTKIQSLFRGFMSRLYIHDHYKLKRDQHDAAKELIICIAHKLHFLLRTRQIPGIYSLRNSHCLSKIEHLLDSLKFKTYNSQVRRIQCDKMEKIQTALDIHRKQMSETTINEIEKKCNERKTAPNYMSKFFKDNKKDHNEVIDKATKDYSKGDYEFCSAKETKLYRNQVQDDKTILHQFKSKSADNIYITNNVCVEIVKSMTKWDIIKDDKNFIVSPVVVKQLDKIVSFVSDVESICHKEGIIE